MQMNQFTINNKPEWYYSPVELTEELLLKCGLIVNGILYEKGRFAIKKWKVGDDIEWVIFWEDKAILYKKPYYLHELQNLYFALTGEELKIDIQSYQFKK